MILIKYLVYRHDSYFYAVNHIEECRTVESSEEITMKEYRKSSTENLTYLVEIKSQLKCTATMKVLLEMRRRLKVLDMKLVKAAGACRSFQAVMSLKRSIDQNGFSHNFMIIVTVD
jgi:hypothetical protein